MRTVNIVVIGVVIASLLGGVRAWSQTPPGGVFVQARGGPGIIGQGGGGHANGPTVGVGASAEHAGSGMRVSVRFLASDLRSFDEQALLLGNGRRFGPFSLAGGAAVGRASARYRPANWSIGDPDPTPRDYASIGVPVEVQATLQGRLVGIGVWHVRGYSEEVPFSGTLLALQLHLGRGR